MNLALFQYISFTTIGKDPKDPSLVSSSPNTIGGCLHIMSAGQGGVGVANKDDCRLWGAGEVYQ